MLSILAALSITMAEVKAQDCNGNQLPDSCDLSCGTPGGFCDQPGCGSAQDCNGNGVPDECELLAHEINFPAFPSTAGLSLAGAAANVSNRIRLVASNQFSMAGALWLSEKQLIAGGFQSTFQFNVNPNGSGGADGFAFVIQHASVGSLGDDGGYLGYGGIPQSLAIEFDTFDNGGLGDSDDNHVAVHSSGLASNFPSSSNVLAYNGDIPLINNATTYTVHVNYQPGRLQVFMNGIVPPVIDLNVNLKTLLGLQDDRAWLGFTGATGGAAQNHDILSWLVVTQAQDCQGDGVPDECELVNADCNHNLIPDSCDVTEANDCDQNLVPDECQPDCDGDGTPDVCAIANCPPDNVECQDCNGNSMLDACELNGGPLDPPTGSFFNPANGHYYMMTSVVTNWQGAEAAAFFMGGHLATIQSVAENQWIISTFAPTTTMTRAFIGLNDIASEGHFVWSSEEPVTYTNWLNGEPNNAGNEDWVEISIDENSSAQFGRWIDASVNRQGIIEFSLTNDCNHNGQLDTCDIASGISEDCNHNGVPDECQSLPDCNQNGIHDQCDLESRSSMDCNASNVPDECELLDNDCNGNLVPDDCEDCNANGLADECDLENGISQDCNRNLIPDDCEDCNGNGLADDCDVANGTSPDFDENGVPDECQEDCNLNELPDFIDIAFHISDDCNANSVPDECDLEASTSADCNDNSIPDECDIEAGESVDCQANGTPDECDPDSDGDGYPNDCDEQGDFDHDSDIDLADHDIFTVCFEFSGPLMPPPFGECIVTFDFYPTGRVDLHDFASFQKAFDP